MTTYTKTQALEVRRALADFPGITITVIAEELGLDVGQVLAIIADIGEFKKNGRDVAGRRIGRRGL